MAPVQLAGGYEPDRHRGVVLGRVFAYSAKQASTVRFVDGAVGEIDVALASS